MSEPVEPSTDGDSTSVWYLEGLVGESRRLRRFPVSSLPFRIGRHPEADLRIPSDSVSQRHAEIVEVGGLLRIRDLGSTNGTFVNGKPISGGVLLLEGDRLHLANVEFVVGRSPRHEIEDHIGRTNEVDLNLQTSRVTQILRLRDVIESEALEAVFQPIVSLEDSGILGFEALGRVQTDGLPAGVEDLFEIAASIGAEAELSRKFRDLELMRCVDLPGRPKIFFNTHPTEFDTPELIESLEWARRTAPDVEMVIELHEVTLTEPRTIRRLRERLEELDIGLAYDDFGAGQARLVDVVEVPPDYLKFDLSLIHGIDQLLSKQKMIESLVEVALDLGIVPTAEGIETAEEADICRQLGFHYGQGYFLGRPAPATEFRNE